MIDYSRVNFPRNDFIRESTPPDRVPASFLLPAPTIAETLDLELFKSALDGLAQDGLTRYVNNSFTSGAIEQAFGVFEADKKPKFSEALMALTQEMVALAAQATDNFDKLRPEGHKVRINGDDYTPWFEKEHEESWKATRWKPRFSPFVVASAEASIDFVVGEVPIDDELLVYEHKYQDPTLFGKRWMTNPKRTRHHVGLSNSTFERVSDELLTERGLSIITLEPGQVAIGGVGEMMRRSGKHEPGTAYVELKFARGDVSVS